MAKIVSLNTPDDLAVEIKAVHVVAYKTSNGVYRIEFARGEGMIEGKLDDFVQLFINILEAVTKIKSAQRDEADRMLAKENEE